MAIKNKKILITCGPTWVPIDDIRTISNTSTGALGQKIALDLLKARAKVTLLEGPVERPLQSHSIKIVKFHYFDEFSLLFKKELRKNYHTVIHAAAVGDYKLRKPFRSKVSSRLKKFTLELVPTPKLIKLVKKIDPKTFLVGFKQESRITERSARDMAKHLVQKAGCDLVVVNSARKSSYQSYLINKDNKIVTLARSRNKISSDLTKYLAKNYSAPQN